MFKIAICDDDKNYRRIVKETVSKYSSNIEGIAFYEYSSGEELLADTHQIHNLLFLDIQMAKMDGNETAKEFRYVNVVGLPIRVQFWFSVQIIRSLQQNHLKFSHTDIL